MNVLQVIPRLNRGGLEIGALQIAKALMEAGQKCIIASETGLLEPQAQALHIPIHYLKLATKNPLTILINAFYLAHFIKKEKIDLIHIRSRAPAWSAFFAGRMTRTPVISTVHGLYSARTWIKKLYNSVMLRPQNIIVLSQFALAILRSQYPAFLRHNPRMHVIYRGIPQEYFDTPATTSMKQILMSKYKLPEPCRILLMCGRISQQKGYHLAIEALKILQDPNLVIVAVGSSDEHPAYRQSLQQKIFEYGLDNQFLFESTQHDMIPYYDAADLVVFAATRPEPFGRVIVEALARRKLVVAAHLGASAELIPRELHPWLFEPNNADDLAAKINIILSLSPDKTRQLTDEAYTFAQQRFREEIMIRETLSLYQTILQS